MTAPNRLPPVPEPPHDPASWLLNGSTGWRALAALTTVDVTVDGSLQLAPLLPSLPPLANPAGTFGNLVLPANVAVAADGSVYLLDQASATLKRFDRCCCAFEDVPCIGASGGGARRWRNPHGIGICGDDLYVCDTGRDPEPTGEPCEDVERRNARWQRENHRVVVFSLRGLAIRRELRPPNATFPDWQPWAIAFDSLRQAFVTDRLNGVVHRFDRHGRWRSALTGFAQPTQIAVDCEDRIYVVVAGADGLELRTTDREGHDLPVPHRADVIAHRFPPLPFEINAAGSLLLAPLCAAPVACGCCPAKPGSGWFDSSGAQVENPAPQQAVQYTGTGDFVAGPLDSRLHRCVWHRVILHGRVPPATKVTVQTFAADEIYTPDQLQSLAVWDTTQSAQDISGVWDCLVRGAAGRYLWLKLSFASGGHATPEITAIEVEFPRISLRRYLPAVFGAEPSSADFTDRLLATFDEALRSIERQIDGQARLFDPRSTPAARMRGARFDFLTWLASWVGIVFDRQWTDSQRRRLLRRAGALFDRRGTVAGLREQLLLLLGLDGRGRCCDRTARIRCAAAPLNCAPPPEPRPLELPPLLLEHYRLRRWLHLGQGRLGEEAVLWGRRVVNRSQLDAGARVGESQVITSQDPLRDPFHAFANKFTTFVPCRYREPDARRRALEHFLRSESPAHTAHQIAFVEPRFRIGVQSMIGFDAVVGAVPRGVRLGTTPLGDTVLTSRDGAPGIAAGRTGRIGTTTIVG